MKNINNSILKKASNIPPGYDKIEMGKLIKEKSMQLYNGFDNKDISVRHFAYSGCRCNLGKLIEKIKNG